MNNRTIIRFCILAGSGIIVFSATHLVIICGLLICGNPVSSYQIVLSLGVTLAFLWWASRYYFPATYRKIYCGVVFCIACAVALAWFSNSLVYDTSWDGQTYHSQAVLQLAQGWNPYHGPLPSTVFDATYLDYYAKGPWLVSASLYKLTGAFRLVKMLNSLHLFASFCMACAVMLSFRGLKYQWSIIFSLLLAFNPVSTSQLFTLYVDGQFSSLLIDLLCVLILLQRRSDPFKFGILASVLITILNVKLTAVVYVGIIAGGFVIWHCIIQKKAWQKLLVTVIGASIIGGVFVGYNPNVTQYFTQLLKTGSPFYPLTWAEITDIERNSPRDFIGKSMLDKLWHSVFSYSVNAYQQKSKLKVPFSVSRSEIENFSLPDVRVGGWGPLFALSLLFSVVTLLAAFIARRSIRRSFSFLIWILLVLASVFSNPESWWARYSPQFWLIPVLIAIYLLVFSRRKMIRAMAYGLITILCLNCGMIVYGYARGTVRATLTRNKELALLYNSTQYAPLEISFKNSIGNYHTLWIGTRITLDEAQVRYIELEEINDSCTKRAQISYSQVRYCSVS